MRNSTIPALAALFFLSFPARAIDVKAEVKAVPPLLIVNPGGAIQILDSRGGVRAEVPALSAVSAEATPEAIAAAAQAGTLVLTDAPLIAPLPLLGGAPSGEPGTGRDDGVEAALAQAVELQLPGEVVYDRAKATHAPRAVDAPADPATSLQTARAAFYKITGGSYDSNDVTAAKISLAQRTAFFKSPEFKNYVAAEKAAGRTVFWLKDIDKTQASGDIFTFYFKYLADKGLLTPQHNATMRAFLNGMAFKSTIRDAKVLADLADVGSEPAAVKAVLEAAAAKGSIKAPALPSDEDGAKSFLNGVSVKGQIKDPKLLAQLAKADSNDSKANAYTVIDLWRSKEKGGEGIGMLDFWSSIYWRTQKGLTKFQKLRRVAGFKKFYASKIYPGIYEDNKALEEAGVEVLAISNGDQELAIAVAPLLGIKRHNVVGSYLQYDPKTGLSTGVDHAYEIFDKEGNWNRWPQPGKILSTHFLINRERHRYGLSEFDEDKIVIAGADGDSAASDGGMWVYFTDKPFGNFVVDSPHEPGRRMKSLIMAQTYGGTKGQYITLIHDPRSPGDWDDAAAEKKVDDKTLQEYNRRFGKP
ncbi:MAG: hypothetical protein HY077_18725 [Elusimicrobia bacterium]|nr:hypothetical protein [Elusimicrobiota bacterium]